MRPPTPEEWQALRDALNELNGRPWTHDRLRELLLYAANTVDKNVPLGGPGCQDKPAWAAELIATLEHAYAMSKLTKQP